jgi:hypothetical protein
MKASERREIQASRRTRTVKISDMIHHKIRVLSVQKRMPMQEFIEDLLLFGLRRGGKRFSVETPKTENETAAA